MKPPIRHCAVYTRKSTEEGLEQEFNTLDAQREGCLAYITSQKAEGWVALPDHYDDGGFSGGNMDRPALKRLIEDIKVGKVNIVVVYKIDRLTRALMDFSKLVEVFDQYGMTFVSITQSFNTTTSMGRLTLNVLLSFAQFEREVIGERVRDKIAASKKKGMWMGGNIPIGYQRVNKQLVPNPEEVSLVSMLFERYLALGCVRRLCLELREKGITSRIWTSGKGHVRGNTPYSRGALYAILSNPVYIGKIRHKDKVYDGMHESIVPQELWQQVQTKLVASAQEHTQSRRNGAHLLTNVFYDEEGTRYTPTHTNKKGRRYRYYISQNLLQYRNHPKGLQARLPADEIEELVRKSILRFLGQPDRLTDVLQLDRIAGHQSLSIITAGVHQIDIDTLVRITCTKVVLAQSELRITLKCKALSGIFEKKFDLPLPKLTDDYAHEITTPYIVTRRSKGAIMIDGIDERLDRDDPFNRPEHEIQNWVKGIVWRDMHFSGKSLSIIAEAEKVHPTYVSRLIDESFNI